MLIDCHFAGFSFLETTRKPCLPSHRTAHCSPWANKELYWHYYVFSKASDRLRQGFKMEPISHANTSYGKHYTTHSMANCACFASRVLNVFFLSLAIFREKNKRQIMLECIISDWYTIQYMHCVKQELRLPCCSLLSCPLSHVSLLCFHVTMWDWILETKCRIFWHPSSLSSSCFMLFCVCTITFARQK